MFNGNRRKNMPREIFISCLLAVVAGTLPAAGVSGGSDMLCNGDADLCDRPYNEVVYPGTHNSYSTEEDGFTIPLPNQKYSMSTQLQDGIRCLMLDTYEKNGVGYLCHGECGFWGQRPLSDGLLEIADFLDANPREVVTIIIESYLSEELTAVSFGETGLLDYAYAHEAGEPWPLLREMLESDRRLVVFTDDSAAALDWHHYVWDFAWETPFSYENIGEFTCEENRGTPPNDLFILNHFLTGLLGAMRWEAPVTNAYGLVRNRCAECWGYEETNPESHIPNFLMVDHYDLGNVVDAVKSINGSWPEPPLWMTQGILRRGESVDITVTGLEPGEAAYFGFGLNGQGIGPAIEQLGGMELDILNPVYTLGAAAADPSGTAVFTCTIPPGTPLIEISTQAAVPRGPGGSESIKSIAITERIEE